MKNKDITKIVRKGKNRIGIIFANYQAANKFISNPSLENKGYEIFIPNHYISCKGIVRFVDKILTEEEIKNYTDTNLAFCKVISV